VTYFEDNSTCEPRLMCLAVPGRVEQLYEADGIRMAKLNFGGVVKEVCLVYLPDISVGEYAIVHVGFAISRIDEASAEATLQTFAELGLLDDQRAGQGDEGP